jgi:hypothetical protein
VVAAEKRVNGLRILVLAVLVAALGGYLYYYEVPQAQKEAEKEKLVGVADDAVTGIELAYADRTIGLAKRDAGWRLTKPVDAPADEPVVKALLTAITGAQVQKSLDELPPDLAPFGLDKPATTITLTVKDGTVLPIRIGKNTTIGAKTYVRKGDEPKIYLTASTIQTSVNKQVRDLRDKQLLTFKDEDVQRIGIAKAGAASTTLARKDAEAWTLEPGDMAADLTEVRSYLSSLRTTRATDFPDDAPADLAKYGLDKPRLTVTVTTGKEGAASTQQLLVGSESGGESTKQVYVKRGDQPAVFAVGDWAFRSLDKDAAALRDKTVLAFVSGGVGRVVLERKEGTGATMVRQGADAWTLDGMEPAKVKATAIQRFVDDLRDLRGSAVAAEPPGDLARFGLSAPTLRIAGRRQRRQADRHGARGEAGRQVLRDARRRPDGLRDARLHVHPARQAGARLRAERHHDDARGRATADPGRRGRRRRRRRAGRRRRGVNPRRAGRFASGRRRRPLVS